MRLPPAYRHLGHQLGRFNADDLYERCGYILYRGPFDRQWLSLVEVPNLADNPRDAAKMVKCDPSDLWTTRLNYRNFVAGTFHTHPGRDRDGGVPSATDLLTAANGGFLFGMVYHPYTRRLTIYNYRGVQDIFHVR